MLHSLRMHTRVVLFALILWAVPSALLAGAGQAQEGVARGLSAVVSDGSTIRIGEVGGRFEVTPARNRRERFGRIRVHSGLVFEARADARAVLPAFVTGRVGDVLQVDGSVPLAHVQALRAEGSRTLARIDLDETVTLEGVPIAPDTMRVEGRAPEPYTLDWRQDAAHVIRRGRAVICVSAGERCVTLATRAPLPLAEIRGREGAWSHVVAATDGLRLEGWVQTRRIAARAEGGGSSGGGGLGPLSDGCPYSGRPALVASGTAVHVRPGGAIWAHLPDDADSVEVHDTRPGTPWLELTGAPGVQRDYPGSTCSLGWVRRDSVTWDVHRSGGLTLASERRGERAVGVVREAPSWLLAAGVQVGDGVVGAVVRGRTGPASNLHQLRRALGIGGTFLIERAGVERTVQVPLAEHCQEPGGYQPPACRAR